MNNNMTPQSNDHRGYRTVVEGEVDGGEVGQQAEVAIRHARQGISCAKNSVEKYD
jgi:hypothetical protein